MIIIGGTFYENGIGITQDHSKAIDWYRKAALQGFINAQAALAAIYFVGSLAEPDYAEAYAWAIIAEDNGGDCRQQEQQ